MASNPDATAISMSQKSRGKSTLRRTGGGLRAHVAQEVAGDVGWVSDQHGAARVPMLLFPLGLGTSRAIRQHVFCSLHRIPQHRRVRPVDIPTMIKRLNGNGIISRLADPRAWGRWRASDHAEALPPGLLSCISQTAYCIVYSEPPGKRGCQLGWMLNRTPARMGGLGR